MIESVKNLGRLAVVLVFIGFLIAGISDCGGRRNSGNGSSSSAPGLIHVGDGTSVGYYTVSGSYGFGNEVNSIFSFGNSFTSGLPFTQNTAVGFFYFATGNTSGSNSIYYVQGATGGFLKGLASSSVMNLISGGEANGVAYSQSTNFIYVPDPVNTVVTYLNATSLNYAIKASMPSSTFLAPNNLIPNSTAVSGSTVIVTDTAVGSAYFLNATSGATINPTGQGTNSYLPFVSASTPCNTASLVGRVITNNQGLGYVLCGHSVVYINVLASPNYATSSLVGSTFTVPGTAPVDITYVPTTKYVVVGGGSTVTTLNGASGAQVASVDISTYACGGVPSISALTYASDKQKIIVADKANSVIYVLNPNLTLSTGSCGTSTFSTLLDVPQPDSLGYY